MINLLIFFQFHTCSSNWRATFFNPPLNTYLFKKLCHEINLEKNILLKINSTGQSNLSTILFFHPFTCGFLAESSNSDHLWQKNHYK